MVVWSITTCLHRRRGCRLAEILVGAKLVYIDYHSSRVSASHFFRLHSAPVFANAASMKFKNLQRSQDTKFRDKLARGGWARSDLGIKQTSIQLVELQSAGASQNFNKSSQKPHTSAKPNMVRIRGVRIRIRTPDPDSRPSIISEI